MPSVRKISGSDEPDSQRRPRVRRRRPRVRRPVIAIARHFRVGKPGRPFWLLRRFGVRCATSVWLAIPSNARPAACSPFRSKFSCSAARRLFPVACSQPHPPAPWPHLWARLAHVGARALSLSTRGRDSRRRVPLAASRRGAPIGAHSRAVVVATGRRRGTRQWGREGGGGKEEGAGIGRTWQKRDESWQA